ncbi:hypothetical protein [Amycolatopsis magusensis]|uniref:hypothetical protein n=1 Tax=Amycolatopsis magusensis TaxID=882444 RepID=UPI0037A841AA
MSTPSDSQHSLTETLADAMTEVGKRAPEVAQRLRSGKMPVANQHEFADMLAELAYLLTHHAEGGYRPAVRVPPS